MPAIFRSIAFSVAVIYSGACHASACTDLPKSNSTQRGDAIDLSFCDFYQLPIGPAGLQPTEKLLQLRGKKVHIVGYMVHEENPTHGIFMLAPQPVSLADIEDGPADDLPASVITAHMPDTDAQQVLSYRSGLWELTGKLEVGNAEENNGRVSYVRLILDQLPPTKPTP